MDDLIDLIYEASGAPDLWPNVLEIIAKRVEAKKGGALFTSGPIEQRWTASPGFVDILSDFIASGWMAKNDRIQRLIALRHAGFVRDLDVYASEQIDSMPMYTEFLRARGVFTSVASVIHGAADDQLVLTIEGFESYAKADLAVPLLDRLRPHLARAGLLSSQLKLERARAAVAALELVGAPAAMLGRRGKLVVANGLFEKAYPAFGSDQPTRFKLHDRGADALLSTALSMDSAASGRSIPIRLDRDGQPTVLHVIPVRGAALDIFASGSAILIATESSARAFAGGPFLEFLFDLTPAESRVAQGIAHGRTLGEIAVAQNTTVGTARSHLKSIFAKTGISRQADLVRLIVNLREPHKSVF